MRRTNVNSSIASLDMLLRSLERREERGERQRDRAVERRKLDVVVAQVKQEGNLKQARMGLEELQLNYAHNAEMRRLDMQSAQMGLEGKKMLYEMGQNDKRMTLAYSQHMITLAKASAEIRTLASAEARNAMSTTMDYIKTQSILKQDAVDTSMFHRQEKERLGSVIKGIFGHSTEDGEFVVSEPYADLMDNLGKAYGISDPNMLIHSVIIPQFYSAYNRTTESEFKGTGITDPFDSRVQPSVREKIMNTAVREAFAGAPSDGARNGGFLVASGVGNIGHKKSDEMRAELGDAEWRARMLISHRGGNFDGSPRAKGLLDNYANVGDALFAGEQIGQSIADGLFMSTTMSESLPGYVASRKSFESARALAVSIDRNQVAAMATLQGDIAAVGYGHENGLTPTQRRSINLNASDAAEYAFGENLDPMEMILNAARILGTDGSMKMLKDAGVEDIRFKKPTPIPGLFPEDIAAPDAVGLNASGPMRDTPPRFANMPLGKSTGPTPEISGGQDSSGLSGKYEGREAKPWVSNMFTNQSMFPGLPTIGLKGGNAGEQVLVTGAKALGRAAIGASSRVIKEGKRRSELTPWQRSAEDITLQLDGIKATGRIAGYGIMHALTTETDTRKAMNVLFNRETREQGLNIDTFEQPESSFNTWMKEAIPGRPNL